MKRFPILLAAALALGACGTQTTGEAQVPFTLTFASDPAIRSFTNAAGWEVELDEATISLGPVALFERAPPTASLLERAMRLLVPTAHAHAGFDEADGGKVRGELLETVVLDLLADEPHAPVELVGIAGPVRSAAIELRPTDGVHAFVRGTARRDGAVVAFEGALALPDDPKSRRITGVPAELELDEGTIVELRVHGQRWLQGADFSTLEGTDGIRPIRPDTQVHGAWYIGARSFGAFTVDER